MLLVSEPTKVTEVSRQTVSEPKTAKTVTFIDLFAGIGGFHLAFHNLGAKCVLASEIDETARKTYQINFQKIEPNLFKNGNFVGDIVSVAPASIPDFSVLCAGFPCQPFSNAGFKKGFSDPRGTLFDSIVKIIKAKKPQAFFLENVSHLLNHDNGETFKTIKRIIEDDLKYSFFPKIVRASDFNLPQLRPRLFMVGFKDKKIKFEFPDPQPLEKTMSDILGGNCTRKIGFTLRVGGRGSGINDRRNWDAYSVDGKTVLITPEHGKEMMGFPKEYILPTSNTQAFRQLGNSVAVAAIQATAKEIIKYLK